MPTDPAVFAINATVALLVQLAPFCLVYGASRRILHGRARMRGLLLAAALIGLFAMAVILTQLPAILSARTLALLVTGQALMIAGSVSWLCLWVAIWLEWAVRKRKIRY